MFDPLEDGPSDDEGMRDEAFPPLPPPHSPGQGGQDEGDPFADEDGDGDVSKLAEVPAAQRKVVKRPQPKLDSHRLISERGLPALRTLFDNVHFKGKGHEAEDLRLLMQKMENWAHRLFPKLQFEEFVDRVEKLGKKKEVQTCLKRIRLDMPLTHEDYAGDGEAAPESHVFVDPEPFNSASFPDDLPGLAHSTPGPAGPSPTAHSPAAPTLTEEQRKRMELNRRRALERKLARQQQHTDPSDWSTDEPTSVPSADVEDKAEAPGEEVEHEDLETPDTSSSQHPSQPPHEEPSAPSASTEREEEEEPSLSPAHPPSNEGEGGV